MPQTHVSLETWDTRHARLHLGNTGVSPLRAPRCGRDDSKWWSEELLSRVLARDTHPGSSRESFIAGGRSGWYAGSSSRLSRFGTATRLSSMKTLTRIVFLGSLFLVPALLHAQGGCVSSPECPTAILGVVGTAGAALYVRWRSR